MVLPRKIIYSKLCHKIVNEPFNNTMGHYIKWELFKSLDKLAIFHSFKTLRLKSTAVPYPYTCIVWSYTIGLAVANCSRIINLNIVMRQSALYLSLNLCIFTHILNGDFSSKTVELINFAYVNS